MRSQGPSPRPAREAVASGPKSLAEAPGPNLLPNLGPPTLKFLGGAAALAVLRYFRSILWPFAAACVLAVLIYALVGRLMRIFPRAPRWTALVAVATVVVAMVMLAASMAAVGAQRLGAEWPLVSGRLDALLRDVSARWT